MFDFKCSTSSCAGPIDNKVIEKLSENYLLDKRYLACLEKCHGGEPQVGSIKIDNRVYRIEKFLTLLDFDSELSGPFKPHFDNLEIDERVVSSIVNLIESEHNTSNSLFSNIMPFAASKKDMVLERGAVDLFCFDYRINKNIPSIALWVARKSMDAYFTWADLPLKRNMTAKITS